MRQLHRRRGADAFAHLGLGLTCYSKRPDPDRHQITRFSTASRSLIAETQATDRAHRIGQTHSVWVVKLVAQGTIEERILALQERKATLADSLYSGATGRKEPLFGEDDLAELLKPLSF